VKRVEPGDHAGKARPDPQRPLPGQSADGTRDIDARRHDMEQRALPPGPPPAFEMTLLELERDLKHLLARIEASRARERESGALQPAAVASLSEARPTVGSTPAEPAAPAAQTPSRTASNA